MNALSDLVVAFEADQGQALRQRPEGALANKACWAEQTQSQDEGAAEGFIDGDGI